MAAEAARDAVELERWHGRGVDLLDLILQSGPRSLLANGQPDGTGTSLDARGASALLLALPLVALACESIPSTLTIRGLAHCGALEPALRRTAGAERLAFALIACDGTAVLRAEADRSEIGPGWSTDWASPLDVHLSVERGGGPFHAAHDVSASDGPLIMLDAQKWQRLNQHATRYLV